MVRFKCWLPALVGFAWVTMLLPVFCHGGQADAASSKKQEATDSEDVPLPIMLHLANAEKGDAAAQVSLAYAYLHGEGIEKNEKLAFEWFMKAAEQGHTLAHGNLGYMYRLGVGVDQDFAQAWKWYRQAAAQNLPGAFCDMGLMYQEGAGVPADLAKAIDCYRKGRVLGDSGSAVNLGDHYARGNVIRRSVLLAQQCYAEAAAGRLAIAYLRLAWTYQQPEVVLRIGESKARTLAIENCRRADEMGVPEAKDILRKLKANGK